MGTRTMIVQAASAGILLKFRTIGRLAMQAGANVETVRY